MTSPEASPPEPDPPRKAGEEGPGIRILLISDEPWWVRSIRSVLDTANTQVTDIGSGALDGDAFARASFDAVLIHAELKEMAPVDLLAVLRLQDASAALPALLISDQPLRREARTAALQAGAWDCLSSPLDEQELSLKLRVFIGAKRGVERAREIGLVDMSTGLYNPQGVMKRAGELTRTSQRYGRPLACAVFSMAVEGDTARSDGEAIDPVERSFTRQMEKALLRTLRTRRRSSDIIGKINDGEIVVLAPETDSEGVITMATRLLEATQRELPHFDGVSHRVHAGCYAFQTTPDSDELDATDVIMRATQALRRAQDWPSGHIERFD